TGIDISSGAIACALILNSGPNIKYHVADPNTFESLEAQKFDVVYSYAVVQHMTDEILVRVLESCRGLIKPDGRLLLQVQLPDDIWRTESDWRNDRSLKGKLRFRYGLHCFGRTEREYSEFLTDAGFRIEDIENIAELMGTNESELESQRLIVASAKGGPSHG